MNTATDSTKARKRATDGEPLVTHQELAALEFEAWEGEPDFSSLPGNLELGKANMPQIRLAYASLFKSKAELAAIALKDDGELAIELVENFIACNGRLKDLCKILEAAEFRMMSAMASVYPEDAA